jgi:kumamolisin
LSSGRLRLFGAAATAAALLVASGCAADTRPHSAASGTLAQGPLAWLLAASTDLGPSHADHVETVVALHHRMRPAALYDWAGEYALDVRWSRGAGWAAVSGRAAAMADAFDVPVHDYRARTGASFYATGNVVAVPAGLRRTVRQVGRIVSFVPIRKAGVVHADVPDSGLKPNQLLRTYNAAPLAAQGYTGKGKTIVFFEFGGFQQGDLDAYATSSGLTRTTPELANGSPGDPDSETPMDLEVAHAIAPDARLIVVSATAYTKLQSTLGADLARMFSDADRKYPGAVWSLSIGWGCESFYTAADMEPIDEALRAAEQHGTSAFDASGDTGGLECKSGKAFAAPPNESDVGLDAVASLPSMTSVGGTALSTDNNGGWIAEQAWTSSALSQGTSGGVSTLQPRPTWQRGANVAAQEDRTHRLAPDVAADADPATGVRIIVNGEEQQGGGTSQSAPIWAGLTVLMNQYLEANGGSALGNINPLLYRAAAATPAAFHDVTLGADAIDSAGRGYDLVTGLGTPNVAVLVSALREAQQ